MRIAVVGATGLIGRAVVRALGKGHEILEVSHRKARHRVDITDLNSIRSMYRELGRVDAVVSAAGAAKSAPLSQLGEADFEFCLANKLMGQVNLVRLGMEALNDGGSFTLTSGVLAQKPMPGSAAVSLVNAGLEGFVRAAALELPRTLRINCVSPGWVSETLAAMGKDPSQGIPAAVVAQSYLASIEGTQSGAVLSV
jgi:NAD(P)-dependent dehydrogenase (short-subunit alcohol dehydrogenase family)